jgi:hypothetical protein
VQETLVIPTGNSAPDCAEQVVAIGATPPWATGGSNVTVTGLSSGDSTAAGAGQAIVSTGTGGGGGGMVGDPQPMTRTASATTGDSRNLAAHGIRWLIDDP